MSNVAVANTQEWQEKKDLIIQTVAQGLTANEFDLFMYVCKTRNLDPLLKQIYAIKRGGKVTYQTAIDGFRVVADRSGMYAGNDAILFEYDDKKNLTRATVTVYKIVQGVRCGFTASALMSEYKPDSNDFMWKKMPETMLSKCAEAKALRMAFPADLSGLYENSEMDQAGQEDAKDVTPKKEEIKKMNFQESIGLSNVDDLKKSLQQQQKEKIKNFKEQAEERRNNNIPFDHGSYVVTVGKKHKGIKLKDIDMYELVNSVTWVEQNIKRPTGPYKEFMYHASEFLKTKELPNDHV